MPNRGYNLTVHTKGILFGNIHEVGRLDAKAVEYIWSVVEKQVIRTPGIRAREWEDRNDFVRLYKIEDAFEVTDLIFT